MGAHLIDGEFQSDKYPTTPRGKVPLSVKDPTAQDLLWEYAQRRRTVDDEFSDDLEAALRAQGYERSSDLMGNLTGIVRRWVTREALRLRDGQTDVAVITIRLSQPQGEDDGSLYLDCDVDETTTTSRACGSLPGIPFETKR